MILIPLILYYPLVSANFNSLDDGNIVTAILNSYQNYGFMSWVHLFFHKSASNYYRPLVWASFILDQYLHLCTPSFMHIENILIHTANGIIIFYICCRLIRLFAYDKYYLLPFFTALVFIINPVNTEAVDWISARTDLMAGFFVFSSFLFLLFYMKSSAHQDGFSCISVNGSRPESRPASWPLYKLSMIFFTGKSSVYNEDLQSFDGVGGQLDRPHGRYAHKKKIFLILSLLFYLLGMLSKESAIGLLPAVAVFLYISLFKKLINRNQALSVIILFFVVSGIYTAMRKPPAFIKISHITNLVCRDVHIKNVLQNHKPGKISGFNEILVTKFINNGKIFLEATGFYFKKLFCPWPLNFAIIKINKKFYLPFGILILIFMPLAFLFIKQHPVCLFSIAWAFCFMLPAMAVIYFHTAWTPLAERYIYLSSFGAALIFALIVSRGIIETGWIRRVILAGAALYIAGFGYSSYARNIVWQSNLLLYRDAVEKSYNFPVVHNQYGVALWKNGDYARAKKEFKIAEKLSGKDDFKYIEKANMLLMDSTGGNDFSEHCYKMALKTKKTKIRLSLLESAIKSSEADILKAHDAKTLKMIYKRQIKYFLKISEIKDKAFYLYKIGQRYLALGLNGHALYFFKKSAGMAPDAYYGKAAKKLYLKLKKTYKPENP